MFHVKQSFPTNKSQKQLNRLQNHPKWQRINLRNPWIQKNAGIKARDGNFDAKKREFEAKARNSKQKQGIRGKAMSKTDAGREDL